MYQPKIIKDVSELASIQRKEGVFIVDAFTPQIKELFLIENIKFIGTPEKEMYHSSEFKDYVEEKIDKYVHVFYPWNNHLVKTVTENDYICLKTNRNQDLITASEQIELYNKRVAVFGMSVGSSIAFLLTQSGISREITIADFDNLDTTNLNRIFAGLHQIGLNKTHVAARRIYEDNPFAKVSIMPEGVNKDNLEPLLKNKEIDLIVEEVDSLPFKIEVRILAIKYKIPIMMLTDNGDGVILHVERYDLGHEKIFGKDTAYWTDKIHKKPPTKEEMGKLIITDIVGGPDKVDPRMLASVQRVIKRELVSWSQLGSAAMLAGVVGTIFAKRILLGENKIKDIRSHIFIPEKDLLGHK